MMDRMVRDLIAKNLPAQRELPFTVGPIGRLMTLHTGLAVRIIIGTAKVAPMRVTTRQTPLAHQTSNSDLPAEAR